MYTKKQIGLGLLRLLEENFDLNKISGWADSIFSEHCRELTPELDYIIMTLSAMEHGPEFEFTEIELQLIAQKLINEEKDPFKMN